MRCSLLLSALAFATAVSAQAATPFKAADIRIDGLKRVSPASVFDVLSLKAGDRVTDVDISMATKQLFDTGFFDQVEVRSEGEVLVIEVSERPAVSRIEIDGNHVIESEDIFDSLRRVGITEGNVLKPAMLDKIEQAIQRQYTQAGRYDATVKSQILAQDRNRVGLKISIFEGSVATIQQISIIGNEAFDDDALLGEMSLKERGLFSWLSRSGDYDAGALRADAEAIRSYYLDRGYFNVEIAEPVVELSENFESVYLTIAVIEGPQLRIGSVNVGGDQPIDLSDLVNKMRLQSGNIFNRRLVNEAINSISNRLGDFGYARAQVRAATEINNAANSVDVTLVITPGPLTYVRRIEFRGNTTTSDVVLRREIPQFEASTSSSTDIELGKINLQRLGFFSQVGVTTRPVPGQDDQMDIIYEVREQSSGSLSASLGFSQGQGVLLGAGISQKNFLGSGNALALSLQKSSSTREARFSFTDPYYTVDGVSRGIDLFFTETDFDEDLDAAYITTKKGLGLSFGYPVGEFERISSRFTLQTLDLKTDQRDSANFPSNVEAFLGQVSTDSSGTDFDFLELKMGVSYSSNSLNKGFLPTGGTRQQVSFDISIPGSDLEYYTASYLGETYIPVNKADDLSVHFKTFLGYGDGYGDLSGLPFLKNFFAGGIRSVRGFKYGSLGPIDSSSGEQTGGNLLVTGSASFQFPMPGVEEVEQARLALFTDVGQVYDDSFEMEELRYSTGLGLIWMTPIGPLSFVYSAALNAKSEDETESFQFSIGSSF